MNRVKGDRGHGLAGRVNRTEVECLDANAGTG